MYGGNDDAHNPEEDYIDADMAEDMTGNAPDPPTDNIPDIDADTNDSNAKDSDYGGTDDDNDTTRANIEDALLESIVVNITENSKLTGVRKYDDNGNDSAITGVDGENT